MSGPVRDREIDKDVKLLSHAVTVEWQSCTGCGDKQAIVLLQTRVTSEKGSGEITEGAFEERKCVARLRFGAGE